MPTERSTSGLAAMHTPSRPPSPHSPFFPFFGAQVATRYRPSLFYPGRQRRKSPHAAATASESAQRHILYSDTAAATTPPNCCHGGVQWVWLDTDCGRHHHGGRCVHGMWLGRRRRACLLRGPATVVSPVCETTAAGRPRRGACRLSAGARRARRRGRFRHRSDAAAFGERARRCARQHAWRRRRRSVSRRRAPVRQRRLGVARAFCRPSSFASSSRCPPPRLFYSFFFAKETENASKEKVQRQRDPFIPIFSLLFTFCFLVFLPRSWAIARRRALGSLAAYVSVLCGRVRARAPGPCLGGATVQETAVDGRPKEATRVARATNKGQTRSIAGDRARLIEVEKKGIVVLFSLFLFAFFSGLFGRLLGLSSSFFFWFSWPPSFLPAAVAGGKKERAAATKDPRRNFFREKAEEKSTQEAPARGYRRARRATDPGQRLRLCLCARARTFLGDATFGRAASIAPPFEPAARERSRGSTSARASLRRKGKGRLWPNPTPILEEPPAASLFRL